MEQIISKEELEELMSIKGEIRGAPLQAYGDYLLREEGEEGLKKLEEAMAVLGYPVKYREIKRMDFYPLGLQALTLEIISKLFNYDDKKFQEIGRFVSKISIILRLFSRYFFSGERVVKEIPNMWRKNYTVGNLKVLEYNEEKRHLMLRLENFHIHPLHSQVLIGYFSTVGKMLGGSEIAIEEIKSPFRGDEYYEFLVRW